MSFVQWFEDAVAAVPEKTFVDFEGTEYTYRELDAASNRVASGLADLGVGNRDVVLVMLPNCEPFVELLFGVPKLGAVSACVNAEMKGAALGHLVRKAGADVAVVADGLVETYLRATDEVDDPPTGLVTVPDGSDPADVAGRDRPDHHGSFDEVFAGRSDAFDDVPEMGPGQPQTLLHTSGTTGPPKWCQISHNYNVRAAETVREAFGIGTEDVLFNPLPLYHANPQCYFLYGTVAARATAAMAGSFSASRFWSRVTEAGVTVLILHHAPLKIVTETTPDGAEPAHDVRVVFPTNREFVERFDVPVAMSMYGSTEAGAVTAVNRYERPLPPADESDEKLSQLAGRPRDDVDVRIFDEHDRELPAGEHGEIVVRPEAPNVIFDGYYDMPDRTVDAWENLWFHTGDLGYVDDAGRLHFVRRMGDNIRVKGEFVNVELVEGCIEGHPRVLECAVVGVPDELGGEAVKAVVRCVEDGGPEPAELRDICERELPSFMVPTYVEFVDEFPRTPTTRKIRKELLR